ncbi:MAG: hypothetical protein HQ538_06360 [Parcubacteria group bacterium]|nr:hypothetical protein [Parcubacteria group bacterium]
MIKSLCWGFDGGEREVSYQSTSDKLKDNELPEGFKTDASIILIFNKIPIEFKAIVNRAITLKFDFSFSEKLKIFDDFKTKAKIEDEVLDYVKTNCSPATKNLSIRSLVILSDLKRNGFNFVDFAEEILDYDEDELLLNECLKNSNSVKEAQLKWGDRTGMSRMSFFRLKKKYQKYQKYQVSSDPKNDTKTTMKSNLKMKGGIK